MKCFWTPYILAIRNISANALVDIPNTSWWRNTNSIPEKEAFVINWRPGSDRIIIVFSDEEEQSYLRDINDPEGPGRPITEDIVKEAARASINLKLYAFSSGGGFGNVPRHWEEIAIAGNGSLFELTSDAVSMYNDLMSIIDEACLPRGEDQPEQASKERPSSIEYIPAFQSSPRYDYESKMCI